ncbi:MAG: aminotransferase class V-fold PLP-dependent enzyme [Planctomycetia bacterium]|nr:aminotransferase class V-fold PLP-dependent enzyme [Planctomycetia bacterium]
MQALTRFTSNGTEALSDAAIVLTHFVPPGIRPRILTTDGEYPALKRALRSRYQEPQLIESLTHELLYASRDELLEMCAKEVREKQPDILALSAVTYKRGAKFPVREICRVAKGVSGGRIITLVDGCQQAGHTQLCLGADASGYPIDIYVSTIHKWLRSSYAGVLVLSPELLERRPELKAVFEGADRLVHEGSRWSGDHDGTEDRLATSAVLSYLKWAQEQGVQRILTRYASLAATFRHQLADLTRGAVTFVSPSPNSGIATAIVTVRVDVCGASAEQMWNDLADRGIDCYMFPERNEKTLFRFSPDCALSDSDMQTAANLFCETLTKATTNST